LPALRRRVVRAGARVPTRERDTVKLTLSSRDLPPDSTNRARIELNHEHIETVFHKADLVYHREIPLRWHMEATMLGRTFVFCSESSSPQRMTRTRKGIALDGHDNLGFLINRSPQAWQVEQGAQTIAVASGAAIVLSGGRPHDLAFGEPNVKLDGWLCRPATMPTVAGFNEAASGLVIPADSPLLTLIKSYTGGLGVPGGTLAPALAQLAERHLADLVALAVGGSDAAAVDMYGGGLKAARTRAVLQSIDKHSDNPALSADTVGRELGVSARQVHRLLEETAKTFYEHLLERRLMRAHQLLADPALCDWKIAEIAARAGFVGVTHFNRLFRARFGDTPSGARAAARRGLA
jgi:AraC-like DNA-binding protein